MTLALPFMPGTIPIDSECVTALVVECPTVFRRLAETLCEAAEADVDDLFLADGEKRLDPVKTLDVILTPVPFSLNRKNLLSALAKRAEILALRPERLEETQGIIEGVRRWMRGVLLDVPHDVEISGLSAAALVKSCGLTFAIDGMSALERLLAYLRLVRDLDCERVFVFFHLRAAFEDDELREFARVALAEKFQMLWIDDVDRASIEGERRIVIDKDQCRIDGQNDDPLCTDIKVW